MRCTMGRWRRWALAIALLGSAGARADVFVLKMLPPVQDDMPTVEMGATVGGVRQNIKVVIDTGDGLTANGGLYVSPAAAARLGMAASAGAAASSVGIGGTAAIRQNVGLPAGFGLSTAALVPPGQAASAPALPASAAVGPLPAAGADALIGSEFLRAYQYGRYAGPLGSYYFLSLKSQGDEANAAALRMAQQAATPAPPASRPDGRPAGTRQAPITPVPDRLLPPGHELADGGYRLKVDLDTGTAVLDDADFLIKSGLPQTLLSEALAVSLGIDVAALTDQRPAMTNFGLVTIPFVDLTLTLFDDPEFAFPLSVGVLSAALNPFGDNVLGGDVLGRLPYWEVNTSVDGLTGTFYAAKVGEPASLALAMAALALMAGRGRRRLHARATA